MSEALLEAPEVGTIWGGRGSTFIVYETWSEDAKVYYLTGRNGLLKTPRTRAFVPLKFFQDGSLHRIDLTKDDVWTRAIADRYGFAPPRSQSDPKVCGRCRRAWGSVLITPRAGHFSVFNWITGKYHSGAEYGETSCGLDATGGEWLWPI